MIIILPLLIPLLAFKLRKERNKTANAWPSLLQGLSKKGTISVYWNLLILTRWTLTIAVIVYLRNYPGFQIQSLLILSLLFQGLILAG